MTDSIRREAAAFDEAALIALASVGLIRRGRKLDSVTSIDSEDQGSMMVSVGHDLVTFLTGAGLGNATCSCPTAGPCQHLVAAILHVQADTKSGARPESVDGRINNDDRSVSVSDWLESVALAELLSFAGTSNLRWAIARLEAFDEALTDFEEEVGVVVRLPTEVEVRFMGPSLTAAFCDPATNHDRRQIVLAALVWQARSGQPAPILDAPRRQSQTITGRVNLVQTAAAAAHDAMTIGIAHLSGASAERFEAIAVEARGVKLYRLGQLASRVASGIEDLVDRRASADAGLLLSELALLHVITELLASSIQKQSEVPLWVAGISRAEYSQSGTIEVLSLGAHPWQTSGGYSGVTGVFYDITKKRFLELGGGRRVRSINSMQLYTELVGWSGAHSLATMRAQRIRLSDALVSASGRLSTSRRTSAQLLGAWAPEELAEAEWDGSLPTQPSRLRGGGSAKWASLRLDEIGSTTFDEVSQRLIWPIRSADRDVVVTIPWTSVNEALVAATEQLDRRRPSHLIGRLWTERGQTHLTPVSAVSGGRLRVLAFDEPGEKKTRGRKGRYVPSAGAPNRSLERVASRVLHLAERGLDDRVAGLLTEIADDASAHGFLLIGHVLRDPEVTPHARLLRAAHTIEEHRHYIG